MDSEPEWVRAQREDRRRSFNVSKGIFAGGITPAIIILVLSPLDAQLTGTATITSLFVASLAACFLARRNVGGSFARSFGYSACAMCFIAGLIFLFVRPVAA